MFDLTLKEMSKENMRSVVAFHDPTFLQTNQTCLSNIKECKAMYSKIFFDLQTFNMTLKERSQDKHIAFMDFLTLLSYVSVIQTSKGSTSDTT